MNCFLSMLIEDKFFDTIEVNFLVAGHTHSKIDQYFSIFSNAIRKAKFIGTPLALEWLLCNAPTMEKDRPLYWRLEVNIMTS